MFVLSVRLGCSSHVRMNGCIGFLSRSPITVQRIHHNGGKEERGKGLGGQRVRLELALCGFTVWEGMTCRHTNVLPLLFIAHVLLRR